VLIVSAHQGYPRWLNSGADFLEIDVRRSKDGVYVISHDEPRPGARYATFEEVLQAAAGRIGLHLDLKEPAYDLDLVGRALARLPRDKLVVTTDDNESIRRVKGHFPGVRAGGGLEQPDADFISLDQQYATNEKLSVCERSGRKVWIWTVDDKRLMRRFIADPRVEGLITNRPDRALKLRSARS